MAKAAKRPADAATPSTNGKELKIGASDAKDKTPRQGKAKAQPAAAQSAAKDGPAEEEAEWMQDEEAPFPRGGGSALTPFEHRQVAQQAREDALFDEGNESDEDAEAQTLPGGVRRMGGDNAPVVAARLRPTELAAGVLTIVAVKEVHSTRAVVSMPDGLTGVLER
jgi:rRNA biogenesis protein RRP5